MDSFLAKLLSMPTAPFREEHVSQCIRAELNRFDIPHFIDECGNILVGAKSKKEYVSKCSSSKNLTRLFIAHMDHPGFHGVKWKNKNTLEFKWHGGAPTADLIGAKVWIANEMGYLDLSSKITSIKLTKKSIDTGTIVIDHPNAKLLYPKAENLFGAFQFRAPVWLDGNRIYTKAADDLAGCYTIVETAKALYKNKNAAQKNFLALLSRGEEVGFIGAIGHFLLPWQKKCQKNILAVSLETSRTLPGAEFNKGPVVRLGDRTSVFTSDTSFLLSELAQKILPNAHQKRIMDGGSCEATAASIFGMKVIGLSIPLGNYHNQNFEGGPDARAKNGPAPEFVEINDINGLKKICLSIMTESLNWKNPFKKKRLEFKKHFENYLKFIKKFKIPND